MKRLCCVALALLMTLSLCVTPSFANSNNESLLPDISNEIAASMFNGTVSTLSAVSALPIDDIVLYGSNDYVYKTEYLPKKQIVLSGFAGGNKPGGDRFQTGGGFWFTDKNGPSVSGGLTLNYLGKLKLISVSVSLGQAGSSGKYVAVPDTEHYFKLYIEKTVEVTPYITYKRLKGNAHANDPWTVYNEGHTQKVVRVNQYAKQVG